MTSPQNEKNMALPVTRTLISGYLKVSIMNYISILLTQERTHVQKHKPVILTEQLGNKDYLGKGDTVIQQSTSHQ